MIADEVKKATEECFPSIGGRDLIPSQRPMDQLYKQTGYVWLIRLELIAEVVTDRIREEVGNNYD